MDADMSGTEAELLAAARYEPIGPRKLEVRVGPAKHQV